MKCVTQYFAGNYAQFTFIAVGFNRRFEVQGLLFIFSHLANNTDWDSPLCKSKAPPSGGRGGGSRHS
jgi:hypothetical protein